MTSVPKPLKFMIPHFETMKARIKFTPKYFLKLYRCSLQSAIAFFSGPGKYFSLSATKWVWNSFEIHRMSEKFLVLRSQKIEKIATFEEKKINTSFQ